MEKDEFIKMKMSSEIEEMSAIERSHAIADKLKYHHNMVTSLWINNRWTREFSYFCYANFDIIYKTLHDLCSEIGVLEAQNNEYHRIANEALEMRDHWEQENRMKTGDILCARRERDDLRSQLLEIRRLFLRPFQDNDGMPRTPDIVRDRLESYADRENKMAGDISRLMVENFEIARKLENEKMIKDKSDE